jgi:hypothetical protein
MPFLISFPSELTLLYCFLMLFLYTVVECSSNRKRCYKLKEGSLKILYLLIAMIKFIIFTWSFSWKGRLPENLVFLIDVIKLHYDLLDGLPLIYSWISYTPWLIKQIACMAEGNVQVIVLFPQLPKEEHIELTASPNFLSQRTYCRRRILAYTEIKFVTKLVLSCFSQCI